MPKQVGDNAGWEGLKIEKGTPEWTLTLLLNERGSIREEKVMRGKANIWDERKNAGGKNGKEYCFKEKPHPAHTHCTNGLGPI